METHDSAYGNKRKLAMMPVRPSIRSSANMHTWTLKLVQAIARKGLGSASATEENDLDDLSEKLREKVSMLCADMLDDVEGPLRRETELVQHLLELTQDPDPAQYQHGGRVLKLIVSGYSLTDDSTEMVQISKMKHGALMRMQFAHSR